MNKRIFALILLLTLIFVSGCENKKADDKPKEENNSALGTNTDRPSDEFIFKGEVTSVDNKKYIEMEIIDSDIAFGTYWVLISEETLFFAADGSSADISAVKVGSIIEVAFSGQVMNSYPPKIAARKIYIK